MKRLLIASLSPWLMALDATGADSLDLAGEWRLRIDPQDDGVPAGSDVVRNRKTTLFRAVI